MLYKHKGTNTDSKDVCMKETGEGTLNFDPNTVKHPFKDGPITTYYKVSKTQIRDS